MADVTFAAPPPPEIGVPDKPKIQFARPGYNIVQTQPDELLRHDISDEELDMLAGDRREAVRNGMWTFLGAALGAFPAGICALICYLWKYATTGNAPTLVGVDLVQLILMVTAGTLAYCAYRATRREDGDEKPLKDRIRERTRRLAGIAALRE